MKIILYALLVSLPVISSADTVNKWTGKDGKTHYGDKMAAKHVKGKDALNIQDTYDQQSYDEGVQRHNETEKYGNKLEKERVTEEKELEKEKRKAANDSKSAPRNDAYGRRIPRHKVKPSKPVKLPAN